jgi:mannitol-1-phosphate 5-dehydrogenase
LVDDMTAEEARKLYTYNMCHAVLAYLGARRGHMLSVACLADPVVRADAEGALDEISQALQAEYGFTAEEMARWVATVLRQTDNPTLGDRVARQAADPRRKLRRTDRLVGPALLARRHGFPPAHLARAIAAALLYRDAADPGAVFVQGRVAEAGIENAIVELCELQPGEKDLTALILSAYADFTSG